MKLQSHTIWAKQLKVNDYIIALDTVDEWYIAIILDIKKEDNITQHLIHYIGWKEKWNKWIILTELNAKRLNNSTQKLSNRGPGRALNYFFKQLTLTQNDSVVLDRDFYYGVVSTKCTCKKNQYEIKSDLLYKDIEKTITEFISTKEHKKVYLESDSKEKGCLCHEICIDNFDKNTRCPLIYKLLAKQIMDKYEIIKTKQSLNKTTPN